MGVAQFLEPRKALLLEMVFCDECHGVRLKNLPGPGTRRAMAEQASLLLERSQMLLHGSLAELQPFRQAARREGGLGGEIPQDQRIDRGSG